MTSLLVGIPAEVRGGTIVAESTRRRNEAVTWPPQALCSVAMNETDDATIPAADLFTQMLRIQGEAARQMLESALPDSGGGSAEAIHDWGDAALKLQTMWLEFHQQQAIAQVPVPIFADPSQWFGLIQGWYQTIPLLDPA